MAALTASDAVKCAGDYLLALYGEDISDILLEEIERVPPRYQWRVTMSFARRSPMDSFTAGALFGTSVYKTSRLYKVLEIEPSTGEVISMKIRELSGDAKSS